MRVRVSLLAAVAALLVCASPASAANFTVNTPADNATCNAVTCSLRGAITQANSIAGADTITVPANSYTLNSQNLGELQITTDVTITGAGAGTTTIRGDGKNARIFHVLGANGRATISRLRLTFASVTSLPTTADQIGGIILVDSGTTLNLDHAIIDRGAATRGGGIAIRGGTANIAKSSINTNQASQDGAGILNLGVPGAFGPGTPAHLTLTDSTVAYNSGPAAGVQSIGSTANAVTVTRSTIARNSAGSNGGTGLRNASGTMTVSGSILVENRGDGTEDNCGGTITNAGGNVENFNDCGFALHDVDNTSQQLIVDTLPQTGDPVLLAIPSTSVAVDLAGACTGADQRDLPRPQGAACDAGAYEVDQPFTSGIDSGPSGVVSGSAASFTFSASEPGVTFQGKLDGPQGPGAFGGCVSPASFGALAPGAYTFTLQATDAGGHVVTSSRSFTVALTPQQTPSPTPTPVVNKSVVIQPISGKVLVKLPGKKTFEPVDVTRGIPNGSTVDTRKGKIRLFAIPKAGKPAENALFYDGIFQVKLGGGITELRLTEQLAKCPSGKAAAAAKKPKTRKLWGDGSGSFRTRGQYSAATVRGTKWLVQDSCGKTLTRVAKGVVSVNDFVKHKTILVRAPHRYTARKKH
jgi:CSLREA domain-containing protein